MDDDELWKLAHDYGRAEAKANELRPRLYAGIYEYKDQYGDPSRPSLRGPAPAGVQIEESSTNAHRTCTPVRRAAMIYACWIGRPASRVGKLALINGGG